MATILIDDGQHLTSVMIPRVVFPDIVRLLGFILAARKLTAIRLHVAGDVIQQSGPSDVSHSTLVADVLLEVFMLCIDVIIKVRLGGEELIALCTPLDAVLA